ncbi:M20 metallopeptidase family protein [Brachyspira murdochii]|uniref:M20 metallopeptidase family protein n=1 Tax=Brachyspira murdochii TaxID=84378 RepID=UPI0012F4CE27|nr:M20 family metallopeptidase [Brachyspira murdochii]
MDNNKLNEYIIKIRRDLHKIPEVGTYLPQTKSYVLSRLKELGISPIEASKDSAIICDIEGTTKSSNIAAIRADMDALPIKEETGFDYASTNGNMHACGHDAHTACLIGAASYLLENKNRIKGKVRLLFQTGEETAKGAKNLIEEGFLNGVNAIVGTHLGIIAQGVPNGEFVIQEGALMSSYDKFIINVKGKGTHGANPQNGIDCVLTASQIAQALYNIKSREITATDPTVISVCVIKGGTLYNILPDEAIIEGTFRAFSEENRQFIAKRIKEIAQYTALANRANAEVNIEWGSSAVVNDKQIALQLSEVCSALGYKKADKFTPTMIGEDFSEYLQKVKGAYILYATGTEKNIPHHNSKFEIDESKLYKSSILMSEWAIKFLEDNK